MEGDHWYSVVTANPHLSGEVHILEPGGDLSFRLFRDGRPLWEKRAPSDWILIPTAAELVVMVGKQFGEGKVTEGPNTPERLWAYDVHGTEIAFIKDTGPIRKLHVLSDGRILQVNPDCVSLLNPTHRGRSQWRLEIDADTFRVFPGERFFFTGTWLRATDEYVAQLFEVANGSNLYSITRSHQEHPQFFAISADQKYAFFRIVQSTQPPRREVRVYEIGSWQQPIWAIGDLRGGPFAADRRHEDGVIALGQVLPSTISGVSEPRLNVWDAKGTLLIDQGFEPAKVDLDRSYLRFEPSGDLRFLFDSQEFHFGERAIP